MKTILHIPLLLAIMCISALPAKSQSDRLAYVVTDTAGQAANWNFLHTVDTRTGVYSGVLATFLNADDLADIFPGNTVACSGVAAIAHDKKNKRLYYTPMLIDRLSYIDLRTMTTHVVTNNFTGMRQKATDQSNIFTRMVIADDNNGYALTNDGRHLVRFTTSNNAVITNLGSLADAPGNGDISVHNGCSSFGGDMVSDDAGNLYLVTFRNHVFKINIQTRIATLLGTIAGLPANFSSSSVAVDHSSTKLVVMSVTGSDLYLVDPGTLLATGIHAADSMRVSDLGNSSVLRTKKVEVPEAIVSAAPESANGIRLYPNPVTGNEFTIQFANTEAGNYTVNMIDVKGQVVASKLITITGKINTAVIKIPGLITKGVYIVRIKGKDDHIISSEKIVVQ